MSYFANPSSTTYYNPFQTTISYPTNKPDPSITYHNLFSNTIFNQPTTPPNMSSDATNPDLQRFTAVGRPMPNNNVNSALSGGMASVETWGRSAPNLLPFRFTDTSIISVPVLPHAEPSQSQSKETNPDPNYDSDSDSTTNPIKDSKPHSSRFSISSFRRKSSAGNAKKAKKAKQKQKQDFVIKQMTRGDYLKYYAKDDDGRYIGTEEPAGDCILNNEEDRGRWGRV